MKKKDNLYYKQKERILDFEFDTDTADVFDDMVKRNVPFYNELQRMIVELAGYLLRDGSKIFDPGCSLNILPRGLSSLALTNLHQC